MKKNKKIKIHVKNNHWAPGSFPTDAEGEKNFTITKEHLDEALKNFPEIKKKEKTTSIKEKQTNKSTQSMSNTFRPEVVDAKVYKLKSAFVKNSVFITLSYIEEEKDVRPIEIFINSKEIGRASCRERV